MRLLLATIFMLLAFAAGSAKADPLMDAAAKLPDGGYSERIAQVEVIANLGDPRAIPLLEALSGGDLHVRKSDGLLVVAIREGQDYLLSDPLTGADLGQAGRRDTSKVKVNNRVRGAVAEALAQLKFASPDAATRQLAAEHAGPPARGTGQGTGGRGEGCHAVGPDRC